jgi:CRP-like cAMP-binding protein
MQKISSLPEFIHFLKKGFELNEEDEQLILKYFKVQKVKKNEILLNTGEKCNKLYFVAEGLLRTFHLNKKMGASSRDY